MDVLLDIICDLITAQRPSLGKEAARLALQTSSCSTTLSAFLGSSQDNGRVVFVCDAGKGPDGAPCFSCDMSVSSHQPPFLSLLRLTERFDPRLSLRSQLLSVPLQSSANEQTDTFGAVSVLELCLRHTFVPALRALGAGSSGTALTPALVSRFGEAERKVSELASYTGQLRAALSSSVPPVTLVCEAEIQAALQAHPHPTAPPTTTLPTSAKGLVPGDYGLTGPVLEALLPRLESCAQRWMSSIRSFTALVRERMQGEEQVARETGEERAVEEEEGHGQARKKRKMGDGTGKSAFSDPGAGGAWCTLATLPSLSPQSECAWWSSAAAVCASLQEQAGSGAGVRLTVACLKEGKKRFVVSSFESELESLSSLSALLKPRAAQCASLPHAQVTAAQDAHALAHALSAACDYIRREIAGSATSSEQAGCILLAQRLLWAVGDEGARSAERILRALCQAQADSSSSSSRSSTGRESLLHLPLESALSVSECWECIEAAWRDGCEAVRGVVDTVDRAGGRRAGGGAGAGAAPARMKMNPLILRLGDRIRVALEFRRGHATFLELVHTSLSSCTTGQAPGQGGGAALAGLQQGLRDVQDGLTQAWAVAAATAGDPLDISDARGDTGGRGGGGEGAGGGHVKARWILAIAAHNKAVQGLEARLAACFAQALLMCTEGSSSSASSALPPARVQEAGVILTCAAPWLWEGVEAVQAAVAPAMQLLVRDAQQKLQGVSQELLSGPVSSNGAPVRPAAHTRWLLGLRDRYEAILASLPSLLPVQGWDGEGSQAWRSLEVARPLIPLVDELDASLDPGRWVGEWVGGISRALGQGAGQAEGELAVALNLRQPVLSVTSASLTAEEVGAVPHVLHIMLPSTTTVMGSTGSGGGPKAEQGGAPLGRPTALPVAVIAVSYSPLLASTAQDIRDMQALLLEHSSSLPVDCTVPTLLRTVALSEAHVRPFVGPLQGALDLITAATQELQQSIELLHSVDISTSLSTVQAVAQALVSPARASLQACLDTACGPDCTWVSDGLEQGVQALVRASSVYRATCTRLHGDVTSLCSALTSLHACAPSVPVLKGALTSLQAQLHAWAAGTVGEGGSKVYYSRDGLQAFDAWLGRLTCHAVSSKARAYLQEWAGQEGSRVTARVVLRAGKVDCEPKVHVLKAHLQGLCRTAMDAYCSLLCPSASPGSPPLPYGDRLLAPTEHAGSHSVNGGPLDTLPQAVQACHQAIEASLAGVQSCLTSLRPMEAWWRVDLGQEASGLGADLRAWAGRVRELVEAGEQVDKARSADPTGCSQHGCLTVDSSELLSRVHDKLTSLCADACTRMAGVLHGQGEGLAKEVTACTLQLKGYSFACSTKEQLGSFVEGLSALHTALVSSCGSIGESCRCVGQRAVAGHTPAAGWGASVHALIAMEATLRALWREGFPPAWTPLASSAGLQGQWSALQSTVDQALALLCPMQGAQAAVRALQAAETGIVSSLSDTAQSWSSCRPVSSCSSDGIPLSPSSAHALCSKYREEVERYTRRVLACTKARVCLGEMLDSMGLAGASSSLLAAEPSPTLVAGAAATLNRLGADIASVQALWAAVGGVWEELWQVRTCAWASVQPKELRATLERCLSLLEAMPAHVTGYDLYSSALAQVKAWKGAVQLVGELRQPVVQERHLLQVATLAGIQLAVNPSGEPCFALVPLGRVLDAGLPQHDKAVREVCRQATGEAGIQTFLTELAQHWSACAWETTPHKSSRVRVITGWPLLLSTLQDHLSSLTSLQASPFLSPFVRDAALWNGRLTSLRQLCECWLEVQRAWQYLEGLLTSSPDIRQQLPSEWARFGQVATELEGLFTLLAVAPQVLAAPCLSAGKVVPAALRAGASPAVLLVQPEGSLQARLAALQESLDKVQAGLSSYLEARRAAFPRFFFLGDEDLLQLLGSGARDPSSISRFLPALFAGIHGLTVREGEAGGKLVHGVCSSEGEILAFSPAPPVQVKADGSVPIHEWLGRVSSLTAAVMAHTALHAAAALGKGLQGDAAHAGDILAWLSDAAGKQGAGTPCEAVLLGLSIAWTHAVEGQVAVAGGKGLHSIHSGLGAVLAALAVGLTGGHMDSCFDTPLSRKRGEQAVTELVHKRDITQALVALAATGAGLSVGSYDWRVRMRVYASTLQPSPEQPAMLTVRMGQSSFTHGLEYHGVGERLVQTPLTDRAYLALTHALHLRLGGSPFGPAGTGKTETVKALGNALGRMVLVFNCDDSFDHRAMGRLLSGLCQAGQWGCFDEFNRLETLTLSSISACIQAIQQALAACSPTVDLGLSSHAGLGVPLSPDMSAFITMNPGYAGRSQLPDNLKALFRPVAMVAPDTNMIAAVTLYTQGFTSADVLSGRVSALFASARTALSPQPHYDWGLRALKTVLLQAGVGRKGVQHMGAEEELLCVSRCILNSILPRLVPTDLAPFKTLLHATFPEVQGKEQAEHTWLMHALVHVVSKHGLEWRSHSGAVAGEGGEEEGRLPSHTLPVPGKSRELAAAIPLRPLHDRASSSGPVGIPSIASQCNEWFHKTVQLASTASARHGLMVLGPPGCGKTAAWRCLLEALTLLDGVKAEVRVVDPKALCPPPGTGGGPSRLPTHAKEQLYGHLDPSTLEWRDGLLTAWLRAILADARGEMEKRWWLVLDGEIDPEWAESLNSTLDDNRLLTLPTGERLTLPPNVRIVMECDSTRHATLATLSRTGMVCFPAQAVGARARMASFLAPLCRGRPLAHPHSHSHAAWHTQGGLERSAAGVQDDTMQATCKRLGQALTFDLLGPSSGSEGGLLLPVLTWAAGGTLPATQEVHAPVMPVDDVCVCQWAMALLQPGIDRLLSLVQCGSVTSEQAVVRARQWSLCALAWAAGAAYSAAYRRGVAQALVALPEGASIPLPPPLRTPSPALCLLDVQLDLATGQWTPWTSLTPSLHLQPRAVLDTGLVVPTVDTLRHTEVLRSCLSSRTPILLCGPPGSGKTMLLNAVLAAEAEGAAIWPAGAHVAWLSFSSSTTADYLLRVLEQWCEYKRTGEGWLLQPQGQGQGQEGGGDPWLVLFCDEINLPAADKYGTARTISFLRGLIEQGGFWAPLRLHGQGGGGGSSSSSGGPGGGQGSHGSSGKGSKASEGPAGVEPTWVSLRNVQFVAACNPPTDAGRVPLPSRLLRHAPVLYIGYPEPSILQGIYATLTRALCKLHPCLAVQGLSEALAAACMSVYSANSSRFTPSYAPQCVYSPRDLSRWVRALYEGLAPLAAGGKHAGVLGISRELLVKLWLHEGLRLFCDRLPSRADRAWCAGQLREAAHAAFGRKAGGREAGQLLADEYTVDVVTCLEGTLLFCDLLPSSAGACLPTPLDLARVYLQARADSFCEETGCAQLTMYDECVEHVLRIDRVLRQPLGHVLLAGCSGTGKTVLPRLVAWCRGMAVASVRLGPRYGLQEFDRDLRAAMLRAGAECEPLAFLFDEGSSLGSAFLERMNALLASGEVPGLWEGEERGQLLAACRAAWGKEGTQVAAGVDLSSEASILRTFTANVQRHLHVVFAVNPQAASFSSKRATSPALFNRCVVDWVGEWDILARAQVGGAVVRAVMAHVPTPHTTSTAVLGPRQHTAAAAQQAPHYSIPQELMKGDAGGGDLQAQLRLALNSAAAARLQALSPCPASDAMHAEGSSSSSTSSTAGHGGKGQGTVALQDAIVAALAVIHSLAEVQAQAHSSGSGPHPFPCPRDYMDMLQQWAHLVARRGKDIRSKHRVVAGGLERIRATESALATLRAGLAVKQRDLSSKTESANAKLGAMVADQQEAEGKRAASLALQAELASKTEAVAVREKQVKAQISAAEPALLEAKVSVGAIGRRELDELRSMGSPPAPVRLCLEAVLVLMGAVGVEDVEKAGGSIPWAEVRRIIKESGFISSVVNAQTESLSPHARRVVQERYVEGDKKNFTFERINGASKACGPLYNWVVSQLSYATILEHVAPLKSEAATLAAAKEGVAGRAQEVARTLNLLEASIETLKKEYSALIRDAEALRSEMHSVQVKVDRAAALVASLARERGRWEGQAKRYTEAAAALPVDCVLGAAYVAYAGWHDGRARQSLITSWCTAVRTLGLPLSPSPSSIQGASAGGEGEAGARALDVLATPAQRLAWQAMGLPADDVSAGNGAILAHYRRFPLLVDPSTAGTALAFLTRQLDAGHGGTGRASLPGKRGAMGGSSSLTRASLSDPSYLKVLEACVRFGTPLLLTDAEVLATACDSSLHALLEHGRQGASRGAVLEEDTDDSMAGSAGSSSSSSSSRRCPSIVRIGDAEVEVSPAFTLYLHAKDATLTYPPDLASRISLCNFATTSASLCDTLLTLVLQARAPHVQAQRAALLSQRAVAEGTLEALQEQLLQELASSSSGSTGSLLEDDKLLAALEGTKTEVACIEREQEAGAAVLASVACVGAAYQPVAACATRAYLALSALPIAVNPLYRYSLGHFMEAFAAALPQSTTVAATAGGQGVGGDMQGVEIGGDAATASTASAASLPPPTAEEVCHVLLCAMGGIRASFSHGMYGRHACAWSWAVLRMTLAALTGAVLPTHSGIGREMEEHVQGKARATDRRAAARLSTLYPTLPEPACAALAACADEVGSPWQRALAASLTAAPTQPAWSAFMQQGSGHDDMPRGWEVSKGEESSLPAPLSSLLHAMRRAVLLKAVRPDLWAAAVGAACSSLMQQQLGPDSSGSSSSISGGLPSTFSTLLRCVQGCPSTTPLLLCCTPGSDGEAAIAAAAAACGTPLSRVKHLAMGSADACASAEVALTRAVSSGGWLVLSNIHLAGEWAAGLVKRLQSMQAGSAFDFRLIMTAEIPSLSTVAPAAGALPPCPLPPAMLLACQRLVVEAAVGVKPAFLRALAAIPATRLAVPQGVAESAPIRALTGLKLSCYARLAWAHACVCDRGRYIPAGWSKAYEHGDADMGAALDTVDTLVQGLPGSATSGESSTTLPTLQQEVARMVLSTLHGARMETREDEQALAALVQHALQARAGSKEAVALGMDGSLPMAWESVLGSGGLPALLAWARAHIPDRLSPAALGLPADADIALEAGITAGLYSTAEALVSSSLQGKA